MIKGKLNLEFDAELNFVVRKLIGDRPVIRKFNKSWALCNRFSGEAIITGELPELVAIGHGAGIQSQCA